MLSEDVTDTVKDMREEYFNDMASGYMQPGAAPTEWMLPELQQEIARVSGFILPVEEWAKEPEADYDTMIQHITETVEEQLSRKNSGLPEEIVRMVEKNILLQVLDQLWKEHIATLDYMRYTIVLRAYGQKDPLNEYKKEAFNMFSDMLDMLRERVTFMTCRVQIQPNNDEGLQLRRTPVRMQEVHETPHNLLGNNEPEPQQEPKEKAVPFRYAQAAADPNNPDTWGKVSRNEPCPCGSGLKYKHCHGKIAV